MLTCRLPRLIAKIKTEQNTFTLNSTNFPQVRHHIHERCLGTDEYPTCISKNDEEDDFFVINKPARIPLVNEVNGVNSIVYMAQRLRDITIGDKNPHKEPKADRIEKIIGTHSKNSKSLTFLW